MAAKKRADAPTAAGAVQEAIDALRQFFVTAERDPVQYRQILDAIPIDLVVRVKGLDSVLK